MTKIIVTGRLREESVRRFRALPGCTVVFAERPEDIRDDEYAGAEIFVGDLRPELLPKMPKLRFVQLYSAGANRFSCLPETIILADA